MKRNLLLLLPAWAAAAGLSASLAALAESGGLVIGPSVRLLWMPLALASGWALFTGALGSALLGLTGAWKAGIAASQLWCLGWAWPLIARVRLPAPHDLPERPLQIAVAGLCLGALAAFLAWALLRAAAERAWLRFGSSSFALRLGALAFVVYLLTGLWTWRWHMTGDAPHYTLMARSLAQTGSLELGEAYRQAQWRSFYDLQKELVPQYEALPDGRVYSEHRPLLALLLAPGYWAAGVSGVLWLQALLAAFATALFYRLLLHAAFSPSWSFAGWATFAFGAPWWVFSQAIYVETLAGVLALWWVAAWTGLWPRATAWLVPALLIWVGTRFYPAAGILCLALVWRDRTDPKRALAAPLLLGASLALSAWLGVQQIGSADPRAMYHKVGMGLDILFKLDQAPRYLMGMLIDQEYGLLTWAPVLVLAAAGAGSWWKRRSAMAAAVLLFALPYIGIMASFAWWHGDMAPNRYLVCMSPLLALAAVEGWRALGASAWTKSLAGLSWALAWVMVVIPWFSYSKHNGQAWPLRLLGGALQVRLTELFPSFIILNPAAWVGGFGFALLVVLLFRKAARAV